MSELIQWPRATYWEKTFNPIIGCHPVSPACANCYAAAMVERFGQSFEPHPSKKQTPPRKGVVFCGNMTDLFGEWNLVHESGGYFHKSCDFIAETLGHDPNNPYKDKAVYLWLTKRAGSMAEWLEDGGWETSRSFDDADCVDFKDCDMSNQFFGFTAENQEWYVRRANDFVGEYGGFPGWTKLWLSCEPLLGPVDLDGLDFFLPFSWVVVGCESGPHRRPCKVEWVESIVEQCMNAKIPVFVKQLDLNGRCVTDINRFPAHLRIRQVPWAKQEEEAQR